MDKYPQSSKLTKFEVIEDGDKVQLQFTNEDRPETFITLEYDALGEAIAMLISSLGQSIALRIQADKELSSATALTPSIPILAGPFRMHMATDNSHVLLDFQSPYGMSFQFAMPPKQAENIAHKILEDLKKHSSFH